MPKNIEKDVQGLKTDVAVIQRDISEIRDHTTVWNQEMGGVQTAINANCTNLALLEEKIKMVNEKLNWNNALTVGVGLVLVGVALKTFGVV